MFGVGITGWLLVVPMLIGVGFCIFYFRPPTGRHAAKRDSTDAGEQTVVVKPFFGVSDVINGYLVEDLCHQEDASIEPSSVRGRPYLLHFWAQNGGGPEQTVDFTSQSWADDEEEGKHPVLAVVVESAGKHRAAELPGPADWTLPTSAEQAGEIMAEPVRELSLMGAA